MHKVNSLLTAGDEKDLLLKIADGDESAYTRLVRVYWKKVLQHALSFAKSYPVAEELTQDVFVQIWKNREKLAAIQSFDNYLFIVSKNLLISYIRKKLRTNAPIEAIEIEDIKLNPENQYDVKEIHTIIMEGASLLQEPRRTVFLLSRIEGRDVDSIAKELAMSPRTIRWHLVQALNYLRVYIYHYHQILFLLLFAPW